MVAHSALKDGIASLAYVPAIHASLPTRRKPIDARGTMARP